LGNFEWAKVFAKVKNGQKKCPKSQKAGTFGKQEFSKMHFRPQCSHLQKTGEKVVTVFFLVFLRKRI
jgi:hypothetical protein